MTSLMSSLSDARQNAFGGATEDQGAANWNATSNIGVPYGWSRAKVDPWTASNPTWARVLRGDLRQQNSPLVVVSAAEVLLARAEAADRGWTSENAATLLQNGVN